MMLYENALGCDDVTTKQLFSLLACILHLGNAQLRLKIGNKIQTDLAHNNLVSSLTDNVSGTMNTSAIDTDYSTDKKDSSVSQLPPVVHNIPRKRLEIDHMMFYIHIYHECNMLFRM